MFRSSEEVLHVLGNILGCLQRGRSSLIVPRKRTIDDLMKSRNMVCFLKQFNAPLCVWYWSTFITIFIEVWHVNCCCLISESFSSKSPWRFGNQLLYPESQADLCSVPAEQCSWYHEVWLPSGRMLYPVA